MDSTPSFHFFLSIELLIVIVMVIAMMIAELVVQNGKDSRQDSPNGRHPPVFKALAVDLFDNFLQRQVKAQVIKHIDDGHQGSIFNRQSPRIGVQIKTNHHDISPTNHGHGNGFRSCRVSHGIDEALGSQTGGIVHGVRAGQNGEPNERVKEHEGNLAGDRFGLRQSMLNVNDGIPDHCLLCDGRSVLYCYFSYNCFLFLVWWRPNFNTL
mmetsp:Transcript_3542/g.5139  ORF Transcript_3542/g.5139 Transcript_3542/m.5139 type:complete len:210 (-) Transcript_3542:17-646(-)